jgi:hypothetical protein
VRAGRWPRCSVSCSQSRPGRGFRRALRDGRWPPAEVGDSHDANEPIEVVCELGAVRAATNGQPRWQRPRTADTSAGPTCVTRLSERGWRRRRVAASCVSPSRCLPRRRGSTPSRASPSASPTRPWSAGCTWPVGPEMATPSRHSGAEYAGTPGRGAVSTALVAALVQLHRHHPNWSYKLHLRRLPEVTQVCLREMTH